MVDGCAKHTSTLNTLRQEIMLILMLFHSASIFRYDLEATDTLLIVLCLCVAHHGVSEAKYAAIDTMSSTVRLATGLPTICQPQLVTFLPHLHDRLTTHPAGIIARAMTQHGHQDTQQSTANIA